MRETALAARRLLEDTLPGIAEAGDESARLLGYSYGPGYKGVICTLIMSQSGVKLGIFRGSELPDPKHLMSGAGKVHRHVQLRTLMTSGSPGSSSCSRQPVPRGEKGTLWNEHRASCQAQLKRALWISDGARYFTMRSRRAGHIIARPLSGPLKQAAAESCRGTRF